MEETQGDRQLFDGWMAAVSAGDRAAFACLYDRLKAPVYGLALSILRVRDDAEDVMQNTFLRVWDCAGQYRPGTDARAWVLKITRNLALMLLRTRRRSAELGDWAESLTDSDKAAPVLDRLVLEALLRYLDETEREGGMLFAGGGYYHKEIAAVLEKTYATGRWKYSNAMKKLKRHLEDTEEPAGKEEHPLWLQTKN